MCIHGPAIIRARWIGVKRERRQPLTRFVPPKRYPRCHRRRSRKPSGRTEHWYAADDHSCGARCTSHEWRCTEAACARLGPRRTLTTVHMWRGCFGGGERRGENAASKGTAARCAGPPVASGRDRRPQAATHPPGAQLSPETLCRLRRAALTPTAAIPTTAMSATASRSPERAWTRPSTTTSVQSSPPATRIRLRDILSPCLGRLRVLARGVRRGGRSRSPATISDSPAPKRPESTIRFRRAPRSGAEPHKTALVPESGQPGAMPGLSKSRRSAIYGLP
jgi:hypothetical protein